MSRFLWFTVYIVRSHQGTTTATERSSVLGGRRARSEHVAAYERSMPVRQPLTETAEFDVPVGSDNRP